MNVYAMENILLFTCINHTNIKHITLFIRKAVVKTNSASFKFMAIHISTEYIIVSILQYELVSIHINYMLKLT